MYLEKINLFLNPGFSETSLENGEKRAQLSSSTQLSLKNTEKKYPKKLVNLA
jgi:hypothetical protein